MASCYVYITTETRKEALEIARSLVASRLAACANVLPSITSVFWWDGAVKEGAEAALIVKTRTELVDRLTEHVRALHSYHCPCVVAWSLETGNASFLAWIEAETSRPLSD